MDEGGSDDGGGGRCMDVVWGYFWGGDEGGRWVSLFLRYRLRGCERY